MRARMMKAAWPNCSIEDDAVIAGIGFGELGELAGRMPVEPAAID